MLTRFRHLRRDERGVTFVLVGLGFTAFFAVTALAIDVGMFMTARSQAQNAADSGALAGAVALVFNDYANRTSSGPAVQSAMNAARANSVVAGTVSVGPADVTFPVDANGVDNRVQVQVYRTKSRQNPISTLIGPMFGVTSADVTAVATAEASSANAETCVAPWTVPDKWTEKQTPPWDTGDSFSAYPKSPTLSPDIYIPVNSTGSTGFSTKTDVGLRIVLKASNGTNISPSIYNPIDLPGSTGASDYRWNIANCNTSTMQIGDLMIPQNGNVVGPTKQGTDDLVAKDPGAYWDSSAKKVVTSMNPSPRVLIVPLYDPYYFDTGKQTGNNAAFKLANFMGFFVEGVQANGDVTGRIVAITGLVKGNGPPLPGSFAKAVRLVQ